VEGAAALALAHLARVGARPRDVEHNAVKAQVELDVGLDAEEGDD
jgi:hypothetical protein